MYESPLLSVLGQRIGHYEVTDRLGEGGMGQVYRARDTRLKREVALKVLPDAFTTDPERVGRFQREAEILAALSHQNIAAIYGLEDGPGPTAGPAAIRALVMELVPGPTLADRIAEGRLPVAEAIAIARQLVDALDYAHERGVLHRDLKPANITVTPDGQVKVLDFGLAKAFGPAVAGSEPMPPGKSATITSPALTEAGVILGTAAYMSPEQVRGTTLDKRADIWAFGGVLYEMLTGTRAFPGETTSDTLAAVLKSEPDWTMLPLGMPAAVRELLQRCLARDPRARLRDIADARLLLDAASATTVAASLPARRLRWLVGGLGLAVVGSIIAAFLMGGWYARPSMNSTEPLPVRRLTVQLPVELPGSTSGGGAAVAIARDGSAIAFTGRGSGGNQLHVHRLSDATTSMIRGSTNPVSPVFSPDGKWLQFGGAGGASFWRAAAEGGEAEGSCTPPTGYGGVRGVSWSLDGRVQFGSPSGLFEASVQGGPCQLVLKLEGEGEDRFLWPQLLPGGRGTLLTISETSDDADSATVVVVPTGTTERRVIVRGARAGRVTASGHLLFARSDRVFAAPFNLDRLEMTAEPVAVLDGVASGQFGGPILDVSDRGDLVYAAGRNVGNRLVWVTRNGERIDVGAPRRSYVPPPGLSPDGRWITVSSGTADHFLSLYSLETGTLTPLTRYDTHVSVWGPDSRRFAFFVQGQGFVIKNRESTSDPEFVLKGVAGALQAWSPDATTTVGSRPSSDGGFELFALNLADRTTRTLLRSRTPFVDAQFSPDGRWLAYASNESGRVEIYVTDFPEGRTRKAVSTDGGAAPKWARNGRELYYLRGESMMAAVVKPGASSIEFERPLRLFDGIEGVGNVNTYSVAPDGRFLFVEERDPAAPRRNQLTLVLNWFEELNRLVPVP